jgi:DNA-binding SARP family transcriptional activator
MPLNLGLLGPFQADVSGAPIRIGGRKGVALVANLVRRGGVVPRESLMALLWPYSGDAQARASLRQTLAGLRRDLGNAAVAIISTENNAVALAESSVVVDSVAFERLARSDSADDLEAALALWRGTFLEGLGPFTPEFDRWAEAEAGALRATFEALLLRLCDAHAAVGRTEEMIATALRLLALDPLQEHVHRRVIDGYRRLTRFDAALRQFEALRSVLQAELGVTPEPATLELIREVRTMRGTKGSVPAAPTASRVPEAPTTPSARPSIAVLPFTGLPDGSDAALLGEGIADEVIVNLSRDRGLLVMARQSSFHPRLVHEAPDVIGAQLGVRFLLSGSVRIAGNRIRIMAHLARCKDAAGVWSETYDREIGDIFAVRSEIGRMVMATVMGRIVDEAAPHETPTEGGNLDAWRLILLGLRQLHAHTAKSLRAAMALSGKSLPPVCAVLQALICRSST